MAEEEYWSDEEVVAYLKSVKVAIEEGLANLGEDANDDVSGFAMGDMQLAAPSARPDLVKRLGPRFTPRTPGGLAASNGHCGIICGPSQRSGGTIRSR